MSAANTAETWSAQPGQMKQDMIRVKHGGGACRKGNYTLREKECFLDIMDDYKHIIEARGNSAESRWQKEQAWESIAIRYNATAGIENLRDRTQLAILWKNLKARCKHDMATAVAPDSIAPPADPIGQKVASLVKRGKQQSEEVEANKCFGILGGVGIKIESNGLDTDAYQTEDGSADLASSNVDTDQSIASPSAAVRQDTEDSSEANRSAVDLSQASESRKRKRTTPDRVIIDTSADALRNMKEEHLGSDSSGSEPAEEQEIYPKGVVVVQPTAVEDELEMTQATRDEPVVSRTETAAPVTTNQRVLFAINRNPKKTPIPILPKITAVHSGYIPTVARAIQPTPAPPARHIGTPYERPQNRQRQTRAPPPPPPPPQQNSSFDPNVLLEQQQQEEHEAKMELYRLQIELATSQLRMAEEEHRVRFAKLQVELQTAQMQHDAKAAQLSSGSS